MANYYEEIKEHTKEDAEGNITIDTVKKVKSVKKSDEPEYIKIYTNMWSAFNNIPVKWWRLFFALARRMSYADAAPDQYNGENYGGQTVNTGGNAAKTIQEECGWKSIDTFYRGLQALQKYNAIRQVSRGQYQINPQFAGRGGWYYSARNKQGGIANLIATFNFRDKTVDTQIIWATDNQRMIEEQAMQRAKEQMRRAYETIATQTKISVQKEPGEFENDVDNSNTSA